MFGYVRTDVPYLYIKDDTLYRAMYCGLCKGIAKSCGHSARMGLSYDVTFLSVLLHNLAGKDVHVEKSHCLTHCIRSRQMADVDELFQKLGALNTLLVYYKYTDDMMDGDKGKGKRLWYQSGYKRAKKAYPELEKIVRENLARQQEVEKAKTDSVDRAADCSATMLAECCQSLLEDKGSKESYQLFYALGKWIYLIDALDDYDKDVKRNAYNPFILRYGAASREELMEKHAEDVKFVFHAIFFDIRESLSKLHFYFNRDLIDNVLLRGLPATTQKVMAGCNGKCKSKKKKKTE